MRHPGVVMVKLADTEGKSLEEVRKGAYYRCFGDIHLSKLLSRVQSLIIKNGYELERMVVDYGREQGIIVENAKALDDLLSPQIIPEGLYLAEKKVIKKSTVIEGNKIEPDFLLFNRSADKQECYVIELKDGHEFDTKSSIKEAQNLADFSETNKERLHYWVIHQKIVGFNAETKGDIIEGFKRKINEDVAMTGAEFCALLGLDYLAIQEQRASDRVANMDEFIDQLRDIDEIRDRICQ